MTLVDHHNDLVEVKPRVRGKFWVVVGKEKDGELQRIFCNREVKESDFPYLRVLGIVSGEYDFEDK